MIKLINAVKTNKNTVEVKYYHVEKNIEFTVEWSNIHPETGKEVDFDLQINCTSINLDLNEQVEDAIREGESTDNDCELYLAIRDTFDHMDCENLTEPAMTVYEYIDKYFDGSQVAFAQHQGVLKQQVTKWISGDFMVIEHQLYSPRRELKP